MISLNPRSCLDAETAADLAEGIAPVELSETGRDSMRAGMLKRIRAVPPSGTLTLRAREGDVIVGEQRLASGDSHVAMPGSIHKDFRTVGGCLLFIQSEMRSTQRRPGGALNRQVVPEIECGVHAC